jgi:hypothetical protein
LRTKARCSEGGVVVNQSDVDDIIGRVWSINRLHGIIYFSLSNTDTPRYVTSMIFGVMGYDIGLSGLVVLLRY